MCFNPYISGAFTLLGFITTYIFWNDKVFNRKGTHLIFLFYTLMELLQTVQYRTVNKCHLFENRFLTEIAYLFVIVQPLIWLIYYYRIVELPFSKGIFTVSICLFLLWMILNIYSRLFYYTDYGTLLNDILANKIVCTKKNEGHLYWQWPYADFYGFNANWLMYLVLWFIPIILCKETWISGLTIFGGFLIALMFAIKYNHMTELPSLWCFISIPLMMTLILDKLVFKL